MVREDGEPTDRHAVAALRPTENTEEDPVKGRIGAQEWASVKGPLGDLDEFPGDYVAQASWHIE